MDHHLPRRYRYGAAFSGAEALIIGCLGFTDALSPFDTVGGTIAGGGDSPDATGRQSGGFTTGEVARRLGVGPTTVRSWTAGTDSARLCVPAASIVAGQPRTAPGSSNCAR